MPKLLIAMVTLTTAHHPMGHITPRHKAEYLHAYAAVAHKFGTRAPGRNIVRWGTTSGRRATDAEVVKSLGVLRGMLTPPPIRATPTTSTQISGGCGGVTPYPGAGQCWAIPYSIVQCESGGQNVPNTQGSGAEGYYQLMSGGTGSRAEQDAAAAALWNGGAGAGNWTCAG